jgi:hypothetical protein
VFVTPAAIADAHRGDGKRFIVRTDEKLTGRRGFLFYV